MLKIKNHCNILDIGCSSGFFLDIAKEKGYQTYGVELNQSEAIIAQKKGHTIWSNSTESIQSSIKYDIITLWDVFEHIKNGVEYLVEIRRKLSDDGIIFLQIPNVNSLAARVIREKCNMFDGLEHVNLYSQTTLGRVAKSAGFKIRSVISVIDEIKVIHNTLNYEDPYYGSFKEPDGLKFLTTDLLHRELLGYKLQIMMSPDQGI